MLQYLGDVVSPIKMCEITSKTNTTHFSYNSDPFSCRGRCALHGRDWTTALIMQTIIWMRVVFWSKYTCICMSVEQWVGSIEIVTVCSFAGSTPNGSIQRRPKSRSASVTRPRPKSVHIGSLSSQQQLGGAGGPPGVDSLPYSSVNSYASNHAADSATRRLSMVSDWHLPDD